MKPFLLSVIALFSASFAYAEAPSIPGCTPVRTSTFWVIDDGIPDGTGTPLSVPINITGLTGTVVDVDLDIDITHTNIGHIDMSITSPEGKVVTLSTDNGVGIDSGFSGVLFDDQAGLDLGTAPFVSGQSIGKVNPEEPLSAFLGSTPNGTWTVKVADDTAGTSGGVLDGLLHITTCTTPYGVSSANTFSNATPVAIPDNSSTYTTSEITVADAPSGLCDLKLFTNISHTWNGDLELVLRAPTGKEITIVSRLGSSGGSTAGTSADNVLAGTTWQDDAGGEAVNDRTYTTNVVATPLSPSQSFSAFYPMDPNGKWTLKFRDRSATDIGTLNAWSLTMKACSKDSDGDSTGDTFDSCPQDAAKLLPGVCGCGVVDSDPEADGVYSCETTKDLKTVKIPAAKALLKTIKVPKTAAQRSTMKSRSNQLKTQVYALIAYANAANPPIDLTGGSTLSKLNKSVRDSVKSLQSRISSDTLKKMSDALKAYEKALDV